MKQDLGLSGLYQKSVLVIFDSGIPFLERYHFTPATQKTCWHGLYGMPENLSCFLKKLPPPPPAALMSQTASLGLLRITFASSL